MIGRFLEWFVCSFLARLFPARYRLIPRMQDGAPMLRQFKIFARREPEPGQPHPGHFGVYLQSFQAGEFVETFHVHRWRHMFSIVLSGWFIEERYIDGWIKHKAGSAYYMDDFVIHRLHAVAPRTWTLFFMFGRAAHCLEGGWGYFDRTTFKYTPWHLAIKSDRRVKSL